MNPHPYAKLTACRQDGNFIYFRIGSGHDVYATEAALRARIPTWARSYDHQILEWKVRKEFFFVIDKLFDNFPQILFDTGAGYTPPTFKAYTGKHSSGPHFMRGWLWLSIFVVIIVGSVWLLQILVPTSTDTFTTNGLQPTRVAIIPATNGSLSAELVDLAIVTPTLPVVETTPTPTPLPVVDAAAILVQRQSNLRSGPGTDFAVQGQATGGEQFIATGRQRTADGAVWYRLENGLWIFADQTTGVYDGLRWLEGSE